MPEQAPALRKRPQWFLWGFFAFLFLCTVAILEKPIRAARPVANHARAISNLKQIGTSIAIYLADHDDRLPRASNWTDALAAYAGDESIFRPPEDPKGPIAVAFMKRLSGMKYGAIPNPSRQALAFETTRKGPNIALNFTEVAWRTERKTAVGFLDTSARVFSENDSGRPASGTGLVP